MCRCCSNITLQTALGRSAASRGYGAGSGVKSYGESFVNCIFGTKVPQGQLRQHLFVARVPQEALWIQGAWRSLFAPWLLLQVLQFIARINTVQYVEFRGYCPMQGGGNGQSIRSAVSGAIVRSWLWSTANRSSPFGNFGIITTSSL